MAREAANHALVDVLVGGFQQMHIAINQARIRVDGAYSKLQNAEAMALHLEIQLGIDKRWELGSEPYNHFRQEASLLNYRTALDELERLIVMRLFELSKLSLSGTGKFVIFAWLAAHLFSTRLQTTSTNQQSFTMAFRGDSECTRPVQHAGCCSCPSTSTVDLERYSGI